MALVPKHGSRMVKCSGTILPPNAGFETLLSEFKRLGIDASAHGRETTRSRVRECCREFHGHCGDAGECDRAQLLGHDRRHEQLVIFVWVWQTATARKARAVAERAVSGRAAKPAADRLQASTVGAAQALPTAASSRWMRATDRRRLGAVPPVLSRSSAVPAVPQAGGEKAARMARMARSRVQDRGRPPSGSPKRGHPDPRTARSSASRAVPRTSTHDHR